MTSDAPGPGTPGSGGPTDDETQAVPGGQWPAELVPPPAPAAPPLDAPPPAAAAPQWGDPAPTQPVPQPAAPPPPGTWGAAPGQPPVQPGGAWGAPPAQPGGWTPPPGVSGGPPSGAWNPQPAQSGNGCLKACLIVGGILVVVGILGVIAISFFASQLVGDMGFNPDGSVRACELIANDDLTAVVGAPTEALPMGGLVDGTIGMVLDRRILPDAPDCWIVGAEGATAATGRIARQDGDAAGTFAAALREAQDQGYFAGSLTGFGSEAFCTSLSETGSFGALVRAGDSLTYVSLVSPATMEGGGMVVDEEAGVTSPETCDLAARIAVEVLR